MVQNAHQSDHRTRGLVFFCVFAAYTTIQFYAVSTYGPTLAANSVSAVYLCYTVSCLVAPAVTNNLGSRTTMSLGIIGYASLVGVCFLLYFVKGEVWLMAVVLEGCVLLGCGAALLWTGQGRLILSYYAAVPGNSGEGSLRYLRGYWVERHWSNQLGTRHGSVVVQRFLITRHRPSVSV
jgi:hypothetical protein